MTLVLCICNRTIQRAQWMIEHLYFIWSILCYWISVWSFGRSSFTMDLHLWDFYLGSMRMVVLLCEFWGKEWWQKFFFEIFWACLYGRFHVPTKSSISIDEKIKLVHNGMQIVQEGRCMCQDEWFEVNASRDLCWKSFLLWYSIDVTLVRGKQGWCAKWKYG